MGTKVGGRTRSVKYYAPGRKGSRQPFWIVEPSRKRHLEDFLSPGGEDDWGDGNLERLGEDAWEYEYEIPLEEEVQKKLSSNFGRGTFNVAVAEEGHLEVALTVKGIRTLGLAKGRQASGSLERRIRAIAARYVSK